MGICRFGDLRSGIAYRFPDFAYDIEAWKPEHVVEVLSEVDIAARNGWWAFGFVSYEAAAASGHPSTSVICRGQVGLDARRNVTLTRLY